MTYSKIKKAIASLLIAALIAPNLVHVDFSYGDNLKKEHDLVILMVEESLFDSGEENKPNTLTGKIYRYADDIRKKRPNTKTKIIRVNSEEHPSEIVKLLEKYYLEGEIDTAQTEVNKIRGVVLIGDIPLPVVKFKHYYLPTIFPYVDLADPAFVWNEQRKQFEENKQNIVPQAEIWHGLIKAPSFEKEAEELMQYFDKNHAFYTGKIASKFDQRIFYGDILNENKKVNSSVLDNYYQRNSFSEDLAYLRFTKHFAARVMDQFSKNVFPSYGIDDDQDGQIDEDPVNFKDDDGDGKTDEDPGDIYKNIDNDGDGLVDEDEKDGVDNDGDGKIDEDISISPIGGNATSGIPDLQSKRLVEKFLAPYAEVVENYLETMNTLVEGSGRWTKSQIDSFPALITKLDALFLESNAPPNFKMSLKNINKHFESNLNHLVENTWQKNNNILASVTVQVSNGNDSTKKVVLNNYINGKAAGGIVNVEDCTLYAGTPQQESKNLAQQVEYNRLYDPRTAGNPSSACEPYGDCCGNYYTSPAKCNPSAAVNPVKNIFANTEKSGIANMSACKQVNIINPEISGIIDYSLLFPGAENAYLYMSISDYAAQNFSSVFKHDEPRNNTIMNAVSNNNLRPNIPVDDPRYIAFQNHGKTLTEIDYFNLFKLKNLSENNDLETIKLLVNDYVENYEKYINRKITEQNLETFKEYLYRYGGLTGGNSRININTFGSFSLGLYPQADFNNTFNNWKSEVFNNLKEKLETTDGMEALSVYMAKNQTNYDSQLNSIFRKYFPQSNVVNFQSFVRQGGVNENIFQSYNSSGLPVDVQLDPHFLGLEQDVLTNIQTKKAQTLENALNEIYHQIYLSEHTDDNGRKSYSLFFKANFPAVANLAENYWLNQLRSFGEEDVYKTVQWLNATLDEKREILFKNYLNQVTPLYPSSAEDGYESVYLRTEGGLDYIDLGVEKAASLETEKVDPEWEEFLASTAEDQEEEFNEIMELALEDECGSFTEGVEIWNWFSAISCWLGNLGGSSNSNKCTTGECAIDQDAEEAAVQKIADLQLAANQDETAEPQILLSSEQRYSLNYNALQKVFVYADPELKLDSVELAISQTAEGSQGVIVGENPVRVVDGRGSTYVKALAPNSKYVVYVVGQNAKSNSIQFIASKHEVTQYGPDVSKTDAIKSESSEVKTNQNSLDKYFQEKYKLVFLNPPKHIDYNSDLKFFVELQDGDSKPVTLDIKAEVSLTELSKKYAYLNGSTTLDFSSGPLQSFSLKTLRESGPLHLMIKSNNDEIAAIGLESKVGNLVTKNEIAEINPQALYATLLGESYADLVNSDTIANQFLFSGKTQAVTTMQGSANQFPVGVNVFPNGRLNVFDENYKPVVTSSNPLEITIYNQANLTKEFSYNVDFPEEKIQIGEFNFATDFNKSGIYLGIVSDEESVNLQTEEDFVLLKKGDQEIVRITNQGEIISNPQYPLSVNEFSVENLFLDILFEDEIIATIALVKSELSKVLVQSENVFDFYAEASTKGKTGFKVLNQEADLQKISFGNAQNLTSAKTKNGVGWTGDYKNELLFAANNTVGDSTKNYASIFEVLLGDPLIKLPEEITSGSNGFDKSVGNQIHTNQTQQMSKTIKLDFNNDDKLDLGVIYSDGYFEILLKSENNEFINQGELLFLADKVQDAQAIDFASDGYDDIIIVTPENKIILLDNDNQTINRQEISLNLDSNITKFELAKMSNDDVLDLVAAFSNGDIRIFYGTAGGTFTSTGVLVDQLGGSISTENLASEVLLNYPNLNSKISESIQELEVSQSQTQTFANSGYDGVDELEAFASEFPNVELVYSEEKAKVLKPFISAVETDHIVTEKRGISLTSGNIDVGHVIQYATTIYSAETQREISMTNYIPANFNFIKNSLQIVNCGNNISLEEEIITSGFPFLISNIDLQPESVCEVRYQVTVTQTPKINFWLEDVAVATPVQVEAKKRESFLNLIQNANAEQEKNQDGYLDIGVNVEGNNTGKIKYLISQEPFSHEYFAIYSEKEELEMPVDVNNQDLDKNGVPDRIEKDEDGDGLADFISDFENEQMLDSDKDGLPDAWDESDDLEMSFSLSGLNNSLEGVVTFLEGGCEGGCLDIPINYAFFVPGSILSSGLTGLASRLGYEIGEVTDPPMVLPVFAWGHHDQQMPIKCEIRFGPYCAKYAQPTWQMQPLFAASVAYCTCNSGDLNSNWIDSWEKSNGRIYLSPTLTGGLGLAVCSGGNYPDGSCFATSMDSIVGSLCDLIGIPEEDAKSNSTSTVTSEGQSIFSIGAGASASKGGSSGGYSMEFGLDDLDDFSFSKLKNVNRHVKEIGGVLTNWVNRQIEEVSNALLDLPTIYLYYPTFDRIFEFDSVETSDDDDLISDAFESDWGMMEKLKDNEITKKAEKGITGIKGAYDTIKSLPFVTVEKEDINIKIPYLDKKAIEILKQDFTDWKDDAKAEIDLTKKEWKAAVDKIDKDEIKEDVEATWDEIIQPGSCGLDKDNLSFECEQKLIAFNGMIKADELISTVEANLEMLETYANLPREIIKYKEGLLGYLTQVTCTLNEIMDLMGGWIVKNLIRYNLWKQFILTIKEILEGWQKILDVMIDYQNSCETCQAETYQFDMWSMVMSLIPEPPIIKFPRWPDIKIDLSQINTNFEIVLPRMHFIPDPIVFPKIPELELPSPPGFSLDGDFFLDLNLDFDLPGIPTLPELPGLPTLPDLPSFSLPDLPDLPPPPRIPEIPSFVSDLLDLVDTLLQVYCLIKKGFWIYDEDTIKSTIEALTTRPGSFMDSFDFLHLNLPNFSLAGFDLLIESQVNLELEADYVAEAAKAAAEPWNSLVTNLVDEANSLSDGVFDDLREALNKEDLIPNEIEIDLNEQLDELENKSENSINEVGDDLQVKVKNDFTQIISRMQDAIKNQSTPKLSPEILPELESPNLRRIKKLDLIVQDYQQELANEIEALKQVDDLKVIAQIPEISNYKLVSYKTADQTNTNNTQKEYFATISPSEIPESQKTSKHNYLAALPSEQFIPEGSQYKNVLQPSSQSEEKPKYNYKGAYIHDQETGQVQPLLEYEDELDSIASLLYLDFDEDGDEDIVYSMGSDLYLKENHKASAEKLEIYSIKPQISDFDSLKISAQAVKNYRVETLNNNSVTVTWDEYKHAEVVGYLISNNNTINQNTVSNQDYYYLINAAANFNVTADGKNLQLEESVSGAHGIKIGNQLEIELKENENFYTGLNDEEYYKFNLPNGFYYSTIYAVLSDGTLSTRSEQHLLAPQIAADVLAPLIVTPQKVQMYLNQTEEIYDEFFLDDSQKLLFDWTTENPQKIVATGSGLIIGKYTEPQNFNVNLKVADESGNQSTAQMEVEVRAPEVTIDSRTLRENNVIKGLDEPLIEDIPITIYRERFGKTKTIQTPSANFNGKYLTNESGEYLIDDLDFDQGVIVKDNLNKQIAYIHAPSGQIEIKDENYFTKVLPATNSEPTRIVILNSDNKIVANQYFVSDYNTDVILDEFRVGQNNVEGLEGVHVFDFNLEDKYQFASLPGNAPYFPGGLAVYDQTNEETVALINVDGKINIAANAELKLVLKQGNLTDPVIFEIRDTQNTLIGEVYIAIPQEEEILEILPDEDFSDVISQVYIAPQKTPKPLFAASSATEEKFPFKDINQNHPAYEAIKELYERQILSGYEDETVRPDTKLSRAEFVKIALGATTCLDCTLPTDAEKNRYDASQPFPDVTQAAWYYYCVAKGKEKQMITGYGDGYFKPGQNISRAEAVAILLREAGVKIEELPPKFFLDVPDYAWYKDYVYTGVQLGIISSNYSLVIPDEQITRGEFAMMAKNLLDIQDCRLTDSDQDGMPDYWEIQNGFDPQNILDGNLDDDNDGIVNVHEFVGGTDPNVAEVCPYINNPNQQNTDGDEFIDVCDDDIDNDNVKNVLGIFDSNGQLDPQKVSTSYDNCVFEKNSKQLDEDQDGVGNVCDKINDNEETDEPEDLQNNVQDDLENQNNYDKNEVDLCPGIPGNNQGCPDFSGKLGSFGGGESLGNYESGIFVTPGDPTECYFIDYAADLRKGDKIFSAISSEDNQEIWSKSAVVEY